MSLPTPTKDAHIVIVGASVLGLSTALHLAGRGYQSITLLDRRPHPNPFSSFTSSNSPCAAATQYAPLHYTSQYHALSLAALTAWAQWNEALWSSPASTAQDRLWINNGFYTLFTSADGQTSAIPQTALHKIAYLERRHGLKLALLASSDSDHVDSATSRMFCIDPFRLPSQGKGSGGGVLDTLGGTILVDAAWSFAVARVKGAAGVHVIFDESAGYVDQIVYSSSAGGPSTATGVQTKDGKTHKANFVIWACDPSDLATDSVSQPFTPLSTQASSPLLTETVVQVRISPGDNQDLWDRLSEDNFPSWASHPTTLPTTGNSGVNLLGFPRDEQGYLQIICRRPIPSPPTNDESGSSGIQSIQNFVSAHLSDLLPLLKPTITTTIQTEPFPNRAIVDRPPSTAGNLLLAYDPRSPHQTFMFLPVVGNAVVDVLEGTAHPVKGWKWPASPSFPSPSKTARL